MSFTDLISFLSPLTFFESLPGMIDLLLLVGIPAVLLKNFWRGVVFFIGFWLSQVTFWNNPWVELLFEVAGIIIMIMACVYKRGDIKDDRLTDPCVDEGLKRFKKQPSV